jgi:ABC-type glycerol-3-phosphate transport system substrate-binding protein
MRRTHKIMAVIAGLATAALALGACGGGDDGGGTDKDGNVTLSFWHNGTAGPGTKYWEDAVKEFEDQNPGVKINIQVVQNEDLDGKLQTALNSNDAPDVFLQRFGGKMADMVEAGYLMDITDSITSEAKAAVGGSLSVAQLDGGTYAMPVSVLPGGFFYSQDLFDAAGITETPKTIEDLEAAVAALKATGVAPIALGAKDAWPAAHWFYFFAVRECSQDVLAEAAATKKFDDECWVAAGEDLEKFAETQPFNDGFLTTSAQQGAGSSAGLLANHKAGMELMGAWDPGVIASLTPDEQPLPDLAWFPFPAIDGGDGDSAAMMGGADGYSCSAKAPKKECTDFLNFMVGKDMQVDYYKAYGSPPVNREAQSVVTEPYLQSILEAYNQAPYVSMWLDTLYGQNVGNALNTGVVDLLAGQGDVAGIISAVNDAAAKE